VPRVTLPESRPTQASSNLAAPDASLFGFPSPVFAAIDNVMAAALAPLPRVIVWGGLMAVLTMFLYRLISPQKRLAVLRSASADSRQRLAAFDGELEGLWPLVRESFGLSLRQIATILGPGLVASLPLVACLVWLDSAFGYRPPVPEQPVRVSASPPDEAIQAHPANALMGDDQGWRIRWPESGDEVQLRDGQGAPLVVIGGAPTSHLIEQRQWWNVLVGNPMGYLPESSRINRLEFGFELRYLHDAGPRWLRSWAAPFFISMIALSILIKVVFRIE
jgi:hypothetical protein